MKRTICFLFITSALVIPFSINLRSYITKSWLTKESDLVSLDIARIRTASLVELRRATYIELITWEGRQFRIYELEGLKDRSAFIENATEATVIPYVTRRSAEKYRARKGLYTEIKQIEMDGKNYLDLNRINEGNRNSVVRNLFIFPIIAVLITISLIPGIPEKNTS